jgi:hypothetical protein
MNSPVGKSRAASRHDPRIGSGTRSTNRTFDPRLPSSGARFLPPIRGLPDPTKSMHMAEVNGLLTHFLGDAGMKPGKVLSTGALTGGEYRDDGWRTQWQSTLTQATARLIAEQ